LGWLVFFDSPTVSNFYKKKQRTHYLYAAFYDRKEFRLSRKQNSLSESMRTVILFLKIIDEQERKANVLGFGICELPSTYHPYGLLEVGDFCR